MSAYCNIRGTARRLPNLVFFTVYLAKVWRGEITDHTYARPIIYEEMKPRHLTDHTVGVLQANCLSPMFFTMYIAKIVGGEITDHTYARPIIYEEMIPPHLTDHT